MPATSLITVLLSQIIGGVGVERRIPIYSPLLENIKVLQEAFIHKGKKPVRRAKLYYLRDRPDSQSTVLPDKKPKSKGKGKK
jgi:large subunit ribosomal protein L19